jgi:hypothetical protein
MGVELLNVIFFSKEPTIELTEKETAKDDKKDEEGYKDKIINHYFTYLNITLSKTHYYLDFSTLLPKPHLSRIELPPELA